VGLVLALLVLASCGEDEPPTPTPVSTAENSQTTPAVAANPAPVSSPPAARLQDVLPTALYFLQDGQIQRLESDGTTLTQFTQEEAPITDYDVSPVDARLVYVSGNRLLEANPQYGTEIVKLDGGPIDEADPVDYVTRRISSPHFSPDGSQIAFGLNGINLIPAGEATEYTTILASDPYPQPNNPPRTTIRLFTPGEWSPDGRTLLARFAYWPEAGGVALLNVKDRQLIELTSRDPNATLCCGWNWGRDGSTGYIASNLLVYGAPGLTRIDAATGSAEPLAIGLPPLGPRPGHPIRLFQSAHELENAALLTFVSAAETFGVDAPYTMQRVSADGSLFTPERVDEHSPVQEVLWADDGSGAVIRTEVDGAVTSVQLIWLRRGADEAVVLPASGSDLRWAPVVSRDGRRTAAQGERSVTPVAGNASEPVSKPTPASDAPQLIARVTLNLRSGPGTLYPVVGQLAVDESVVIVGVSPDHTWWQVAAPVQGAATAWVIGDPDFVETQNTGDVAVVTPPPPPSPVGRIFFPGRDPDGHAAIFVQNVSGGSAPELVVSNASQPSLSADGTQLAVRSVRSDILGIGVWTLANERMRGLTSHKEDTLPRWSPAGDAVVFGSTRHGDRRWRVYVQPTTPGEPVRPIAFGLDPDWHPSTDLIAYKGCDSRGERCGIWTMDSLGQQQRPVTDNKSDSRPVWSPNGQTIVFMSESRDGNWELYSVDAGGNVVTRLTDNPANDGLPVVSPDGRQIAFVSNRGGAWGVWTMPIVGGSPERVFPLGADLPNWLEQSIDWTR